MESDKLSYFQLVANSCPSFWANYHKANLWLKDQGFNPMSFRQPMVSPQNPQVELINDDNVENPYTLGDEDTTEDVDDVDDDYVRFIIETRKHQKEREELRAKRLKDERDVIVYTDIGEIDIQKLKGTDESRLVSKLSNHENLYGTSNESIKAKEVLLQNDFNVYYDTHKPQFWPTIPIKIK